MWRVRALVTVLTLLWLLTQYVVVADDTQCDCSTSTILNCSARNLSSFVYEEEKCEDDAEIIDASLNQITSLDLTGSSGAHTLNVSHNNIEEINLHGEEKLEEIDVSYNKIRKFDATTMIDLKNLWVNDNLIDELLLPSEDGCKLEQVSVSGNKLSSMSYEFLHTCKEIVYFNASRNLIEELSQDILRLLTLEEERKNRSVTFDLRDNPITDESVENVFDAFEGPLDVIPNDSDCMCAQIKSIANTECTLNLCLSSKCPDNKELWTSLGLKYSNDSPTSTETPDFHSSNTQGLITNQSANEAEMTTSPSKEEKSLPTPTGASPSPQPPPPSPPPAPKAAPPFEHPLQEPSSSILPAPVRPLGPEQPVPTQLPPPQTVPTFATELSGSFSSTSMPSREGRRRRRLMVMLVLTAVGLVVAVGCAAALIVLYRRRRRQVERERAANSRLAMQPLLNTTPRFMRSTDDFVS